MTNRLQGHNIQHYQITKITQHKEIVNAWHQHTSHESQGSTEYVATTLHNTTYRHKPLPDFTNTGESELKENQTRVGLLTK